MLSIRRLFDFFESYLGSFVLICAAYIPFLGSYSVPLTGDQKVYISTAIEMQEKGSYLTPLLFGEPSYFKPPLQYWATILGWKIFGFNLWGTLLPSFFCVLLIAWLLGQISRLLNEKGSRGFAGLLFASTIGAVTYGTTAQMEIYVCAVYLLSWWCGLRFLYPGVGERNCAWLFGAFIFAGVSALIKSPLYSVLWVVSYLTYLLVEAEWELFRNRKLYVACAVGVAVGFSWFVYSFWNDGTRFWADYFQRETFGKKSGNGGSVLSLWWALFYYSLPFAFLIFPALKSLWRSKRAGKLVAFVACYCWPPAVFFSLHPYRVKPYLFILVPTMALSVEWVFLRASKTLVSKILLTVTGALVCLVLVVVAIVLKRTELVPAALVPVFIVVSVWLLVLGVQGKFQRFFIVSLIGVLLFRYMAVCVGEADISGLRQVLAQSGTAPVAMLDEKKNIWHEVGLLSVATQKRISRLYSIDEAVDFLARGGLLILSDEQESAAKSMLLARLSLVGKTHPSHEWIWPRWKSRIKFPFKKILSRNAIVDKNELRISLLRYFYIIQM